MNLKLTENQIVWAKLAGFPWWPAYVKRIVSDELYEIEYFGEFERNFFDRSRIRIFNEIDFKANQKNVKLFESYNQAIKIINNQTTIEKERESFFSTKFRFVVQYIGSSC